MTLSANTIFGGGSGIRLAPDLTFPSTINLPASGIVGVTGVNTTAALTEMLGLSGKYAIEYIELFSLTTESAQIKLTIDGVIIWNDTFVLPGTSLLLCGAQDAGVAAATAGLSFICNTSFSLEVQMSTDTSIDIDFLARKIL